MMPSEAYEPIITPGRELYEQWLFYRGVSPDDLWDHLDAKERWAWERVAREAAHITTRDNAALSETQVRVKAIRKRLRWLYFELALDILAALVLVAVAVWVLYNLWR